ncbi:hypothetical protein SeGA_0322, partial [Salmonella enterica subsp. enterica serovar Gaminara str. A4-567]
MRKVPAGVALPSAFDCCSLCRMATRSAIEQNN